MLSTYFSINNLEHSLQSSFFGGISTWTYLRWLKKKYYVCYKEWGSKTLTGLKLVLAKFELIALSWENNE